MRTIFKLSSSVSVPNPIGSPLNKTSYFNGGFIHNYALISSLNDSSSSDTMTLDRQSSKVLIKDDGTVEVLTIGTPAFTGSGILIEDSHTNKALQSQNIDTAPWTDSGGTTTTGSNGNSPVGTDTVSRITAGVNAAKNQVYQDIAVTANATLTASVFLKKGNLDWAEILVVNTGTFANRAYLIVNVNNGTVTSENSVGTFSITDSGVTDCGNGWYHFWMTFTTSGGFTNVRYAIAPNDSGTTTTTSDIGDTLDMWQVDLQEESALLSSVVTTTTSATSLKDDYTMPLDEIPANNFYIEFQWTPLSAPVNGDYIISLTSGTNGMEIYYSTGFINWTFPVIGESGFISGTPSAGTTYTIRITKTSSGGVEMAMTGFTTDTDATATSDITWPAEGNVGSRYTDANHSHCVIANLKVGDA